MNAASFALNFFKNYQLDQSVKAGGFAAVATVLVGTALVAAGVAIPPLGVLGFTASIPLTESMVLGAALPISHLVTALIPAKLDEQLTAVANNIGVSLDHLKSFMPQVQATYPTGKNGDTSTAPVAQGSDNSNINKG